MLPFSKKQATSSISEFKQIIENIKLAFNDVPHENLGDFESIIDCSGEMLLSMMRMELPYDLLLSFRLQIIPMMICSLKQKLEDYQKMMIELQEKFTKQIQQEIITRQEISLTEFEIKSFFEQPSIKDEIQKIAREEVQEQAKKIIKKFEFFLRTDLNSLTFFLESHATLCLSNPEFMYHLLFIIRNQTTIEPIKQAIIKKIENDPKHAPASLLLFQSEFKDECPSISVSMNDINHIKEKFKEGLEEFKEFLGEAKTVEQMFERLTSEARKEQDNAFYWGNIIKLLDPIFVKKAVELFSGNLAELETMNCEFVQSYGRLLSDPDLTPRSFMLYFYNLCRDERISETAKQKIAIEFAKGKRATGEAFFLCDNLEQKLNELLEETHDEMYQTVLGRFREAIFKENENTTVAHLIFLECLKLCIKGHVDTAELILSFINNHEIGANQKHIREGRTAFSTLFRTKTDTAAWSLNSEYARGNDSSTTTAIRFAFDLLRVLKERGMPATAISSEETSSIFNWAAFHQPATTTSLPKKVEGHSANFDEKFENDRTAGL